MWSHFHNENSVRAEACQCHDAEYVVSFNTKNNVKKTGNVSLNTLTATDEYTRHPVHATQPYTGTTGHVEKPAGTSAKLNHTREWHSGKNWPGSERVKSCFHSAQH